MKHLKFSLLAFLLPALLLSCTNQKTDLPTPALTQPPLSQSVSTNLPQTPTVELPLTSDSVFEAGGSLLALHFASRETALELKAHVLQHSVELELAATWVSNGQLFLVLPSMDTDELNKTMGIVQEKRPAVEMTLFRSVDPATVNHPRSSSSVVRDGVMVILSADLPPESTESELIDATKQVIVNRLRQSTENDSIVWRLGERGILIMLGEEQDVEWVLQLISEMGSIELIDTGSNVLNNGDTVSTTLSQGDSPEGQLYRTIIASPHIVNAYVEHQTAATPYTQMVITLTEEGEEQLSDYINLNQGHNVALIKDNQVWDASIVLQEVVGNRLTVLLGIGEDEARGLILLITHGPLPVSMNIVDIGMFEAWERVSK